MTIALWGPKGSGKTSLIHAFGVTIAQRYSSESSGFTHMIYEYVDGRRQLKLDFGKPDEIQPTTKKEPIPWAYVRKGVHDEPAYKLRSQYHKILIYDDQGGDLVDMLHDKELHQATFRRVAESESVIILLDPTLISDVYTKEQYFAFIKHLFYELDQQRNIPKRNIAVCLTKADRLEENFWVHDPWDLLKDTFDNPSDTVPMSKFLRVERFGSIPKAFALSTRKMGVNEWKPVMAEYPFFFLFEQMESERLTRVNSGFFSRLFQGQRQMFFKKFPYPEHKRHAE